MANGNVLTKLQQELQALREESKKEKELREQLEQELQDYKAAAGTGNFKQSNTSALPCS